MPLVPDDLAERANADGELRVAARFWDATLRLDLGDESRRLRFAQGRLLDVERCAADAACDVSISGARDVWEQMLERVPRPFFHDPFAAQLHHGLRLEPDPSAFAAYYPALRRLVELLREARS